MVRFGENHPGAKLTNKDILLIRELWAVGHRNVRVIARNFNVSQANIKKIVKRKTWKHL